MTSVAYYPDFTSLLPLLSAKMEFLTRARVCVARGGERDVVWPRIFVCPGHGGGELAGGLTFGKSTIRCSGNDDVSSRSSPMVSLSQSIQRVTNGGAVGVLQGQGSANSQYDDNPTLAFSFPEENDPPVGS